MRIPFNLHRRIPLVRRPFWQRAIPIVMQVSDPLATGLVASLARPAGNLTGILKGARHYADHISILIARQACVECKTRDGQQRLRSATW
jgi:hypothetical protein